MTLDSLIWHVWVEKCPGSNALLIRAVLLFHETDDKIKKAMMNRELTKLVERKVL